MPLTGTDYDLIQQVAALLKGVNSILFITGAGLSADSNLPTYRGIGGLYQDHETEEGIAIEEALSGEMMVLRPEISWKYIKQIEGATRLARHNRGHAVIAEMEKYFPKVWVLTQNVDGFHHDAGSQKIIDIHGSIKDLKCTRCLYRRVVLDYAELQMPPYCSRCGGVERPEVVLFGEQLPIHKLSQIRQVQEEGFQLVFTIGTSSLFQYIVDPVLEARRWNVPTVEINPDHTPVSHLVDLKISGRAAETLEAIWKTYKLNAGLS